MGGGEVTVIVPARNAAATLPALLDCLAAQTRQPDHVVVVDDASTDRTAGVAAEHRLGPQVLPGAAEGSYAARNLGLLAARGDLVAFTDADCRPRPDWIASALDAVRPDVVIGGRIVQRGHSNPSVWERYDRATYLDQVDLVRQGFAATANLVCHTRTLRDVGGFEGTLRSSGDRELGRRLREAGVEVRYCAGAVVEHEPRTDLAGVWALHRRLGRGWRDLHRLGGAPPWWAEPALRVPLGHVVDRVAADGPALRRRQLAPVHCVAMSARWVGRALG